LAKKVFKKDGIKKAIKNIADDFRYSNDMSKYALLFYKVDKDGEVRGSDIDTMREYIQTGLEELEKEFQTLEWRAEQMESGANDEIALIENLRTIEEEYLLLRDFLK
jgi:hypothetical protein